MRSQTKGCSGEVEDRKLSGGEEDVGVNVNSNRCRWQEVERLLDPKHTHTLSPINN
jgi:hypothetical protein